MAAWVTFAALLLSELGFAHIGTREGVRVYQAEGTPTIVLRAEGELPGPPEAVLALLVDYPSHPKFVSRLRECRVFARGDNEAWVYQRLDLPVIHDRDFMIHVRWRAVGDGIELRSNVENDKAPPPRKGVVRLPKLEGHWQLLPSRDGAATFARYTVQIDFGGSVPRSMVRSGSVKDLPAMFQRFRDELKARHGAR